MSAKILVVDDEKSSVEATVEVLEREGMISMPQQAVERP